MISENFFGRSPTGKNNFDDALTHLTVAQKPNLSAFDPTKELKKNLELFFDSRRGVKMGIWLQPVGDDPPSIFISGNLYKPIGLQVKCTKGGDLGDWQFKWSLNNGKTWLVSDVKSASKVVLEGTEYSLNIGTGTATEGDTWYASVDQWNDLSGNLRDLYQGSVSVQPLFIASDEKLGNNSSLLFGMNSTSLIAFPSFETESFVIPAFNAIARPASIYIAFYANQKIVDDDTTRSTLIDQSTVDSNRVKFQVGVNYDATPIKDVVLQTATNSDLSTPCNLRNEACIMHIKLGGSENPENKTYLYQKGCKITVNSENPGDNTGPTSLMVGTDYSGNDPLFGAISHIIVFSRYLTNKEHTKLMQYLSEASGVQLPAL